MGPPELLIILALGILLFGASKLPDLAHGLGQATKEFERGNKQVEQELEDLREEN